MKADEKSTSEKPARSRRHKWLRRGAITLAVCFVLYTLGGFFLVPWIATSVAPPRISKLLNGTLTIAKARFNPFTYRLAIEGLEVTDEAGARVAGFDQFVGNFDPLSTIFRPGFRFHRIHLTSPDVNVIVGENGELNLLALPIPPADTAEPSEPLKKIPRVVVTNIGFEGASMQFTDLSLPEPFGIDIANVDFSLDSLDTAPDVQNPINFDAQTSSGATLRWRGSLQANPLSSEGTITLEGLNIPIFMPYALPYTDVHLREGIVGVNLSYKFDPANRPRVASATIDDISVVGLEIDQADEPYLTLEALRIAGVSADADARRIQIESIAVESPEVFAVRGADGEFRLTRILKERQAAIDVIAREKPSAADAFAGVDPTTIEYPVQRLVVAIDQLVKELLGPWDATIQDVTVNGGTFHFDDRVLDPPQTFTARELNVAAGPITSDSQFETPFSVNLQLPEEGSLRVEGVVRPLEQAADVTVVGEAIDLAPLGRYAPVRPVDTLPALSLAGASASLDGKATAKRDGDGALKGTWAGRLSIHDVSVDAEGQDESLVAWSDLDIEGDADFQQFADGGIEANWNGATTLSTLALSAPLQGGVAAGVEQFRHEGMAQALVPPGSTPVAILTGNLAVTGFDGSAPQLKQAAVQFARLDLTDLQVDTGGATIVADRLAIDAPTLSASTMLVPPIEADDESADATEGEAPVVVTAIELPFAVTLNEFTLTNGAIDVRDDNAVPPARIVADELEVQATTISTDAATRADIKVASRVQGSGALRVDGSLSPFDPRRNTDVQVSLSGLPLDPYDPFSARFVGFLIDRGRLTLALPIRVEDGRLDGTLDVNLDTFYLGERVENPAAPNVPVKLGLNLLRDANEQIDVRIPIQGDTTQPGFRLGPIIWKAFFGLVVNAATSPFKALASVLGASDDADLSFVAFEPGSASVTAAEASSLDALARALKSRPGLSLLITPRLTPDADRFALQQATLKQQLLTHAQERDTTLTTLTDARYRQMVADTYADTFGSVTAPPPPAAEIVAAGADGATPASKSRAPQPQRRGPWFDRDYYSVPGRSAAPPPTEKPAEDEPGGENSTQETGESTPEDASTDEPQIVPFEDMERALALAIAIPDESFAALAARRAQAVYDLLTGEGGVDASRMTLTETPSETPGAEPGVDLELE